MTHDAWAIPKASYAYERFWEGWVPTGNPHQKKTQISKIYRNLRAWNSQGRSFAETTPHRLEKNKWRLIISVRKACPRITYTSWGVPEAIPAR